MAQNEDYVHEVCHVLFTTAAQMGLLGRILPFLIAEHVPTEDEHW